jgi:hypothetical protein
VVRLRSPSIPTRGRRRLRVDAITPIVMTTMARARSHVCPTGEILQSSLAGGLCYRLSPTHRDDSPKEDPWSRWVQPRVCLSLVERHTEPVHVPLGGKFGRVSGWQGHVIVEVNAVAHWLLVACERGIGLGGRTAFGFGRIRVTPC